MQNPIATALQRRAAALDQAAEILNRAAKEVRACTKEELLAVEKLKAEADDFTEEIARLTERDRRGAARAVPIH